MGRGKEFCRWCHSDNFVCSFVQCRREFWHFSKGTVCLVRVSTMELDVEGGPGPRGNGEVRELFLMETKKDEVA